LEKENKENKKILKFLHKNKEGIKAGILTITGIREFQIL